MGSKLLFLTCQYIPTLAVVCVVWYNLLNGSGIEFFL